MASVPNGSTESNEEPRRPTKQSGKPAREETKDHSNTRDQKPEQSIEYSLSQLSITPDQTSNRSGGHSGRDTRSSWRDRRQPQPVGRPLYEHSKVVRSNLPGGQFSSVRQFNSARPWRAELRTSLGPGQQPLERTSQIDTNLLANSRGRNLNHYDAHRVQQRQQQQLWSNGQLPIRETRVRTTIPSRAPPPQPSKEYLLSSQLPARQLSKPQPLLVILDLNKTLLYRQEAADGRKKKQIIPRPFVREFLSALLDNGADIQATADTEDGIEQGGGGDGGRRALGLECKVMIWSSATPMNVQSMVDQLFSHSPLSSQRNTKGDLKDDAIKEMVEQKRQKLAAIWARDTLGLSTRDYGEKVQVYKPLTQVWKSDHVQRSYPSSTITKEKTPSGAAGADVDNRERNKTDGHDFGYGVRLGAKRGKDLGNGHDDNGSDIEGDGGVRLSDESDRPPMGNKWGQHNTVLIDDSVMKGSAEPFNLICIPNFKAQWSLSGKESRSRPKSGPLSAPDEQTREIVVLKGEGAIGHQTGAGREGPLTQTSKLSSTEKRILRSTATDSSTTSSTGSSTTPLTVTSTTISNHPSKTTPEPATVAASTSTDICAGSTTMTDVTTEPVLKQILTYLHTLSYQANVSAYIRRNPFCAQGLPSNMIDD